MPTLAPSNVVIQSSATGITFVPDADVYVDSANPGANYGTSTELRVNGSPVANGFLRFDAKRLTGNVQNAKLRVYANSSSNDSISAYFVGDNTWRETGITFNSAPAIGSLIGSAGPVAAGTWLTFDVTAVVPDKGTYSFALATTGGTPVSFASRESGANAPQLVIETGTPTPTPTVTATPTATATETNTPTPTSTQTLTPTSTSTATATATATLTSTPTPTMTPIPGAICVTVFDDANSNGLWDTSEALLAPKNVTVRNSSQITIGTWDGAGAQPHCWSPWPGDYDVTETDPPGYGSTTANNVTVAVASNNTAAVQFGDKLCFAAPPHMRDPIFISGQQWLLLWDNLPGTFYTVYASDNSIDPEVPTWTVLGEVTTINYLVERNQGTYFYVTATDNCGTSGPSNVVALP